MHIAHSPRERQSEIIPKFKQNCKKKSASATIQTIVVAAVANEAASNEFLNYSKVCRIPSRTQQCDARAAEAHLRFSRSSRRHDTLDLTQFTALCTTRALCYYARISVCPDSPDGCPLPTYRSGSLAAHHLPNHHTASSWSHAIL